MMRAIAAPVLFASLANCQVVSCEIHGCRIRQDPPHPLEVECNADAPDLDACGARCEWSDAGACLIAVDALGTEDPARQIRYLDHGCHQHSGQACRQLGDLLTAGELVPIDPAAGGKAYERGCVLHDAYSCWHAGNASTRDDTGMKHLANARGYYDKACELGEHRACRPAGLMFEQGKGGDVDLKHAAKRFATACEHDDAGSCAVLGRFYTDGTGVERNVSRGRGLLERGCKLGSVHGCAWLGLLLYSGKDVPADHDRAIDLLQSSCEAEHQTACYGLGKAYLDGKGVPQDVRKGEELLGRACEKEEANACLRLGAHKMEAVRRGEGPFEEAIAYVERACKLRHPDACAERWIAEIELGDPSLAVPQLEKLCDYEAQGRSIGDPLACGVLALHYGDDMPTFKRRLGKAACDLDEPRGCAALAELAEAEGHAEGANELRKRACGLGYEKACESRISTLLKSVQDGAEELLESQSK